MLSRIEGRLLSDKGRLTLTGEAYSHYVIIQTHLYRPSLSLARWAGFSPMKGITRPAPVACHALSDVIAARTVLRSVSWVVRCHPPPSPHVMRRELAAPPIRGLVTCSYVPPDLCSPSQQFGGLPARGKAMSGLGNAPGNPYPPLGENGAFAWDLKHFVRGNCVWDWLGETGEFLK